MSSVLKKQGVQWVWSALLALMFSITVFTACNPIWYYAGVDSACFAVVGRGILGGMVPYVDFIDNKGPVLYLLNALAQLPFITLNGAVSTIGIWLLELVCLFFSLRMIDWICRKLSCRWGVMLQMLYLLLLLPLIEVGNMGEEYSNFFTLLAFCMVIKFVFDETEKHTWQYGLTLGILFALCLLIRPNNALPIAGLVFMLVIGLCVQKRFQLLLISGIYFTLGFLAVLIPILIYLGTNNAISAWLEQTVLINLKYSGDSGSTVKSIFFSKYGMAATGMFFLTEVNLVLAWSKFRNNWKSVMLQLGVALSGVVSFYSAFISGFTFYHYLLIGTIPLLISIVLLFAPNTIGAPVQEGNRASKAKTTARVICQVTVCLFVVVVAAGQIARVFGNARSFLPALKDYTIGGGYHKFEMPKLTEHIPEDEKESVYILESGSTNACNYYIQTELLPTFPAFIATDRFFRLMPGLEERYHNFFENTPPKWVLNDRPIEELNDYRVRKIMQEKYELVQTNSYNVSLYTLVEQ